MRKVIKLLKKYGFCRIKEVKHGKRFYNSEGQYVQIASSPRTGSYENAVKQAIGHHLGVPKSTIS